MKKLYIIANWKSNKTESEAKDWLHEFSIFNFQFSISEKEIIICPPFTLLPIFKSYILNHKSNIKLGAQNISPFDGGAYTGEVNGKQIGEFAKYVIIGHSERRKNFFENDEIIGKKIEMAMRYGLTPILCISDLKQIRNSKFIIHNSSMIVAYEPLFAIGSGTADTPENANQIAKNIKEILGEIPVLYGGSVVSDNVGRFSNMSNTDGVLIGKASLDAKEFYKIIENA